MCYHNTRTKLHFTFNLWTSPNHRTFLCIIAYWISSQQILQSTVSGMKHFSGRHMGENHARHFWAVVETYHL